MGPPPGRAPPPRADQSPRDSAESCRALHLNVTADRDRQSESRFRLG